MKKNKQKSTINVTGLSVQDILQMDVTRLNITDLKKVTTRLVSAMNKRIKRLEKSNMGMYAPSIRSRVVKGKKGVPDKIKLFSVKNKSRNKVLEEFGKMKQFSELKTSTVKGFKQERKKLMKSINTTLTPKQEKRMWKLYNEVLKSKGNLIHGKYVDSREIHKILVKYIHGSYIKNDDIVNAVLNNIDQMYLKQNYEQQKQYKDSFDLADENEDIGFTISNKR